MNFYYVPIMWTLCVLLIVIPGGVLSSEVAALILARGGSKGVHLKNIQTVGGVTLLTRTIHTAKLAGIQDITVSTDHPVIAFEALKSGSAVFHRGHITASDWAPSIWGASEFLLLRPEVEILILLQATSPFTRPSQIRLALEKISLFDCIFSVTRSHKLRWRKSNGRIIPSFNIRARPSRQSWEGDLLETGAFYLTRRSLIQQGYFQNDNCSFVEIPTLESLEIDTYSDLKLANILANSKNMI